MDNTDKKPKLLRVKKVSDLLGVHRATLRRWDNAGILKAMRIGKRRGVGDRWYRREDIENLIKK